MSPELIAIITAAIALAGLILITTGRLGTRLTAVEKETARLSGLLEGLELIARPPRKPYAGDTDA